MGADLARLRLSGGAAGFETAKVADELADVLLPDPFSAGDGREKALDVDLLLQALEGGQRVLARRGERPGVDAAVGEFEDGPALIGKETDRSRAGHHDPGIQGVLAHVGEDVVPNLVPADVPHQEDHVGQGLVEFERLDLEPDTGQDRIGHGPDPGMIGPRREEEGQRQGQQEAREAEEDEGAGQSARPDAERPEGDDLGVGGEAGETAQDAHQHGHRQGENEERRDEQPENAERLEERNALVDEELGEKKDLVHQEDEGDEEEPDEEGRHDLAKDVPVDKARHDLRQNI